MECYPFLRQTVKTRNPANGLKMPSKGGLNHEFVSKTGTTPERAVALPQRSRNKDESVLEFPGSVGRGGLSHRICDYLALRSHPATIRRWREDRCCRGCCCLDLSGRHPRCGIGFDAEANPYEALGDRHCGDLGGHGRRGAAWGLGL
jgi:hypothetical protein